MLQRLLGIGSDTGFGKNTSNNLRNNNRNNSNRHSNDRLHAEEEILNILTHQNYFCDENGNYKVYFNTDAAKLILTYLSNFRFERTNIIKQIHILFEDEKQYLIIAFK